MWSTIVETQTTTLAPMPRAPASSEGVAPRVRPMAFLCPGHLQGVFAGVKRVTGRDGLS
jgi:hypothetical protein